MPASERRLNDVFQATSLDGPFISRLMVKDATHCAISWRSLSVASNVRRYGGWWVWKELKGPFDLLCTFVGEWRQMLPSETACNETVAWSWCFEKSGKSVRNSGKGMKCTCCTRKVFCSLVGWKLWLKYLASWECKDTCDSLIFFYIF